MEDCAREDGCDCGVRVGGGPGDEEILSGIDDSFRDCGDLPGGLALPEDHLREALTDAAVMIDPGETEIFKGAVAQKLKEPGLGRLRRNGPGLDGFEQAEKLGPVHRDKSLTRVDFGRSWAINFAIVPCDGIIFL
jgi:hypothetical protein